MQQRGTRSSANARAEWYWRVSLINGFAVIAAVAVLLTALLRTVDQIEDRVARIWQAGKLIANNTVHVPLLVRTNQLLGETYQSATGIERATYRARRAVTTRGQ